MHRNSFDVIRIPTNGPGDVSGLMALIDSGALDDLRLYYEVGIRVASSRRFPRWYPNSEYRESRERRAAP